MDYLGINDFNYRENEYHKNGCSYKVTDIIELSKHYESFDLPIAGIDISVMPWGGQTIKSFCYHTNRIEKITGNYPIILDDEGFICDGWHRLVKSITSGFTHIKAVRLKIMPEPIKKD